MISLLYFVAFAYFIVNAVSLRIQSTRFVYMAASRGGGGTQLDSKTGSYSEVITINAL